MATTATLFTPTGKAFPFIGIGVAAAQLITPIPSAEFVFQIIGGTVTVAAGGEDQSILVNCNLPRSFCYVLVELTCRIESGDAADWLLASSCTLQDSAAEPDTVIPIVFENVSFGALGSGQRTYQAANVPSKLIVPLSVDNGVLATFFKNPVVDGVAGTLHFYARFLRYDRNQAQFWQVNTPVLIR